MKKAWLIVLCLAVAVAFAAPAVAKIPSRGKPVPRRGLDLHRQRRQRGAGRRRLRLQARRPRHQRPASPRRSRRSSSRPRPSRSTARLTIDNTFNSDSDIYLTAEGGGITINGATIRANDHLILECKPALCPINIQNSVIRTPDQSRAADQRRHPGHRPRRRHHRELHVLRQEQGRRVLDGRQDRTGICGGGPGGCRGSAASRQVRQPLCGPSGHPLPRSSRARSPSPTPPPSRAVCIPGPHGGGLRRGRQRVPGQRVPGRRSRKQRDHLPQPLRHHVEDGQHQPQERDHHGQGRR